MLEGSLRARAGDEERTLGVGDEIDIPRGTVHQMWNPASGDARVLWQTRPGGRTESWFAAIDALHREGRVGRNGMPGPLAFAALLTEYDDVFRLAVGPEPLVRGALAALAPLGRMRGYGAPRGLRRSARGPDGVTETVSGESQGDSQWTQRTTGRQACRPMNDQPRKRLLRSTDDRVLAGVAGGIASYLDVDPTLVRVGLRRRGAVRRPRDRRPTSCSPS